ncbi:pirin family protein [uncultured Sunxiuqinia sp.]|uniref:pirin family protein n=1 Tax=uncultured Sunxiuqinia sp. TaxID=1573825 RepID=UPI002621C60C|nr:pirin family protein [uncultured Sunxiuqinia sp.]
MKSIKKIHQPVYEPIQDLVTYRAIPTPSINYLDPFLFLNHHGPQTYAPNNSGLPFGPHPHRGMETVTFILEGDIAHFDSSGGKSVIEAGGVQWMTAGRGLIHAEVSSDEFKQKGGPLEILQLWINLPAQSKMNEPFYKGLHKEAIPTVKLDEDRVQVNLVSGEWHGKQGPFHSGIGAQLATVNFKSGGHWQADIPESNNIFFYLIQGELNVNGQVIQERSLVEFEREGQQLKLVANKASVLLLGYAPPLNEPVVSQGPFVMNTREEIEQAYEDYQNGKFGRWVH